MTWEINPTKEKEFPYRPLENQQVEGHMARSPYFGSNSGADDA